MSVKSTESTKPTNPRKTTDGDGREKHLNYKKTLKALKPLTVMELKTTKSTKRSKITKTTDGDGSEKH